MTVYNISTRAALPEELDPWALRMTWAAGQQTQVRDLVGSCGSAGHLRRVVLELLRADPCLVQNRRAAYNVLLASASSRAMIPTARMPE